MRTAGALAVVLTEAAVKSRGDPPQACCKCFQNGMGRRERK